MNENINLLEDIEEALIKDFKELLENENFSFVYYENKEKNNNLDIKNYIEDNDIKNFH